MFTVVAPPPPPPGSEASAADTTLRGDLLDVTVGRKHLAWTPEQAPSNSTFVERGRNREFLRDVWCLEFAFRPPRMIDVDVPVTGAKMRRKRIWYLVYRVRNTGGRRTVVDPEDATTRKTEAFERPIRFVPHFVLESLEPLADAEGSVSSRAYLDRLVPAALGPIQRREGPERRLLDSAAMSERDIEPGEERWGVATWEDVDPRIDFFSVYVRGLTNALRWRPRADARPGAADPPGAGLEQAILALRLDFWIPGDDRATEHGREIQGGFAGLFERTTLGSRLLEALGRPRLDGSQPANGFERLGLAWSDLLEPDAGEGTRSLLPLEKVIGAIDAIADPADRGVAVRLVFGSLGAKAFEELASSLAAPVEAGRDAERRAALAGEPLGLTPEDVERDPLKSLAKIVRTLESRPTVAERRDLAARLFGPAAPRIEWLARQVALGRTTAALDAVDADVPAIAAGDALAACDAARTAIDRVTNPDDRRRLLQGLFGPRGPDLYAAATAGREGIDHAWVFRYETDGLEP
jgi:hypothetical protein